MRETHVEHQFRERKRESEARRSGGELTGRLGLLLLVATLLVAAGVRLLGLGNTNLWGDEAFSVMTSLGPPNKLLGLLATVEPHPPLYPFLLVVWLRLFGASEFVARLPSAFVGIASVSVAAAIARSFVPASDRRRQLLAGVVAALLVALNPFQVWYSQEARMYAQVSFFGGLATLALLRLWRGKRGAVLLYAGAVVGAAGSHYYGLFVPLAHGVAVLLFARRNRPAFVRWIRGASLAALLYLPWVYIALHIFTSYYGGAPGSENLPAVALSAWARVLGGWSLSWTHAEMAAGVVSFLALVGFAVPARADSDRFVRVVLLSWLFVPFVGGYTISLVRPLLNERYLIVSSLPAILLVARGITWLLSPSGISRVRLNLSGAVLGSRLLAGVIPLHNVWIGEYLKSAYDTQVKTADLLARPGDAVILDGTTQKYLYEYYARSSLPFFVLPILEHPPHSPLSVAATQASLADIKRRFRGAWVFWYASPLDDPGNVIGRWLAENAYRSLDTYAANARLQYYQFAPSASLAAHPSDLTFGKSLTLVDYALAEVPERAGDTIPLDLAWRRSGTGALGDRVAVRLVDTAGFTWAQADESIGNGFDSGSQWPEGKVLNDHHGLMIPTGTPPGTYLLLLNVYNAQHPQPFAAKGSGASIRPGGVLLAQVRVNAPSKVIWTPGIAGFHARDARFKQGVEL
ncbi:MAG: glycosyltransferase family 39 protein, partial [Chloroflexi bacterium]|nr:glycosyltransferase family 39 protein [Chloroflexota bacterium]